MNAQWRQSIRRLLHRLNLSPVPWANFGPASRFIAMATAPTLQPVLIISRPRSGSTWVGGTLGRAANALYLREPVTQTHIRAHPEGAEFELDISGPPNTYLKAARAIDAALPAFHPDIAIYPEQWRLRHRRLKRLVIKEVNPLALRWFIERWQPKVVFLIRHPAGVAASYAARRWWIGQSGFERRFRAERFLSGEIEPARHAHSQWSELGAVQALILNLALEQLRGVADHLIVKYEALCEDPLKGFAEIYDFAGLDWSGDVERHIRAETEVAEHDRSDVYETTRNSRRMAQSWREDLTLSQIADVKDAYLHYRPPFYQATEW